MALGLGLGVLALAILLNGAESWWARVVTHLGLIVALIACLRLPSDTLARSGRMTGLLAVPALVAVLCLPALVPLPPAVLAVLSPGTLLAFPGQWHPAAIDPEGVVYGLGVAALVAGVVAVIATAAPQRRRRLYLERYAAVVLLVVAALYAVHALLAPPSMYGLIPVRAPGGAAGAPFVNVNFIATLLLAFLPVAIGGLVRRRAPHRPWTWVVLVAVLSAIAAIVSIGSLGAFLVGTMLLCIAGLRAIAGRRAAAVGTVLGGVLFVPAIALEPYLVTGSSVDDRLEQWWRSLPLITEYPAFGTGLGGYLPAFSPHAPPLRPVTFTHLHDDPGQLLLELGVVPSLLLVALVLWTLRPVLIERVSGAGWWVSLGVLAMCLHSLVDFPLHMPALLLVLTALVTWRLVGHNPARELPASRVRWWLGALIGVQVVALMITAWLGPVRAWSPDLLRGQPAAADIERLAWMAPWRAEPALARARQAARDGDKKTATEQARVALARAPHHPDVLLGVGRVLAVTGELDEAAQVLERADLRDPGEYRSRALGSRVAEARGDRERALALWTEAVRRWPWEALVAEQPFDRAFELQPVGLYWLDALDGGPDPSLSVFLGYVLLRRDEPFDALLAFDQGAVLNPKYAWVPRRGVAMARTGDSPGALRFLEQADQHENHGESRLRRARLLAEHERWDEARADAYAALRKNPEAIGARLLVLQATERLDGPQQALDRADLVIGPPEQASVEEAVFLARTAEEILRYELCVRWLEPKVATVDPVRARYERCLSRAAR